MDSLNRFVQQDHTRRAAMMYVAKKHPELRGEAYYNRVEEFEEFARILHPRLEQMLQDAQRSALEALRCGLSPSPILWDKPERP